MPPLPEVRPQRLIAIDALRGLVMLMMAMDHVRFTFYHHHPITDPMDVTNIDLPLFLMRSVTHICAPVFIFLAGLSAMLFHQKVGRKWPVSTFLFQRGLILILLEATAVNFAWVHFGFPKLELYVIWALGVTMIILAVLLWLPKLLLLILALDIVAGHNTLDYLQLKPDNILGAIWLVLHNVGWVDFGVVRVYFYYPLLPWIGTISLGYVFGALFKSDIKPKSRTLWISSFALAGLTLFFILRMVNLYGDKTWVPGQTYSRTVMSFFNLTKYPASFLYVCLTLAIGLALLVCLECLQESAWVKKLALFGGAPLFMYLFHIYLLKALYFAAVNIWGENQRECFGFEEVWQVALSAVVFNAAIFWPVCAFARLKARRRDIRWLKYF